MQTIPVTVLLPVYNCEKYLSQAIDSVLQQTFTDFELLIINDGSTDKSEEIILSYNDARIRYLKNETNKGLIFTLNRGIDEAKGKYIARMDGDDVCLPERLSKQKSWLDVNAETAVVASFVEFIDENNLPAESWKIDRETVSADAIRKKMPKENCIAHPSVTIRKEILLKYYYAITQKNIEDYDLWLRLLNDNCIIEKISETLLLYRVHNASVTKSFLHNENMYFKMMHCKRKFLWQEIKKLKWNFFSARVLLWMKADFILGCGKSIKSIFVR